MTRADGGNGERRSEVIFLPDVVCPICSNCNVVVEIEIEATPILSCTACGHTSRQKD